MSVSRVCALCRGDDVHRIRDKLEERCGHELLYCAAETSDDGTFLEQKLDLCIAALADTRCSAIFEQRLATQGKGRRRGLGHPALRRIGSQATTAVVRATATAASDPDPPQAGPKGDAVEAFGTGPRPLALAGGTAALWVAVVATFRLARRWCSGRPKSGHRAAGGASPAGRATSRAATASAAQRAAGDICSRAPGAALPLARGVSGGEVGTGSDQVG